MADRDAVDAATTERVLAAGGVSKRRRNLSNKTGGDKIRSPQPKSQRRRPGTPEPEKRTVTDDSEISDVDIVRRASAGERGTVSRRTRSRDRPPKKDTTTEMDDDDFEIIRRLHKAKRAEEDEVETQLEVDDAKPKVVEMKTNTVKEMPPLIMAPEDTKRRPRPKTLQLNEDLPTVKPRSRSRPKVRRLSTSEEEDERNLAVKGKLTLKPKEEDIVRNEVRRRRLLKKKSIEKSVDVEEPLKNEDPPPEEKKGSLKESIDEPKPWFFQRWFSSEAQPEPNVLENESNIEELPNEAVELAVEKENTPVPAPREPTPENEESKEEEEDEVPEELKTAEQSEQISEGKKWVITQIFSEWRQFKRDHSDECAKLKSLRNRCASSLLLILLFCGMGGFIFRFTESAFESFYKCGVKRVKRDFIDSLWGFSQYMPMEDWKSQARRKLMEFENELHEAHEAGLTSYSGQKSWSYLNAVVYSITIVTTIGYGHISPVTATGRAITIIYAIFGIPMFLILLADFGKLFTRIIKFVWAFVRRLYYTGSCRKVRRTGPVQEVMKGVQLVYDFARRSSQMPGDPQGGLQPPDESHHLRVPEMGIDGFQDSPATPVPSQFEIDDEFNLPISVAITILVAYIFVGATIYCMWEEWTFFESFYFVFISMSTIGFGDYVPQHPMYMMASMVYLVFGLALTSMCINVVQEKLSDTFRQASAKIGATIGLHVAEEAVTVETAPAELADVQPDLHPHEKL